MISHFCQTICEMASTLTKKLLFKKNPELVMFLGKPKPYQTDPKTAGDSLIGSMSGEIATHPSAEKLEK
jgi:hypothetical protein